MNAKHECAAAWHVAVEKFAGRQPRLLPGMGVIDSAYALGYLGERVPHDYDDSAPRSAGWWWAVDTETFWRQGYWSYLVRTFAHLHARPEQRAAANPDRPWRVDRATLVTEALIAEGYDTPAFRDWLHDRDAAGNYMAGSRYLDGHIQVIGETPTLAQA